MREGDRDREIRSKRQRQETDRQTDRDIQKETETETERGDRDGPTDRRRKGEKETLDKNTYTLHSPVSSSLRELFQTGFHESFYKRLATQQHCNAPRC